MAIKLIETIIRDAEFQGNACSSSGVQLFEGRFGC